MKGIYKVSFLFLDQATNITGWSIFHQPFKLFKYGLIDLSYLPKYTDEDQTEKRYQLVNQVRELIYHHKINMISTEGVYGGRQNLDTFKKLAQTQSSLQDWSRRNGTVCYSWKNAGEWRAILGIKSKNRAEYKPQTKEYVLSKYDIENDVEKIIFDKYHNPEKHSKFSDLSKENKETQFDIYDSIAMSDAYFIKIGEKRE